MPMGGSREVPMKYRCSFLRGQAPRWPDLMVDADCPIDAAQIAHRRNEGVDFDRIEIFERDTRVITWLKPNAGTTSSP